MEYIRRKDKRGISGVIVVVIMIAIALAVTGIVWVVINNLIEEKIESTESCFGIFDKVTINSGYTCYNSTSKELQFSINIGDIEVDEILVAVSSEGTTNSFKLSNNLQKSYLKNYGTGTSYGENLILPGEGGGRTYVLNMTDAGLSGSPDSLNLAPVIGGEQCGASDSLSEFDNCALLY